MIRPNPSGDRPIIAPSAFIDPTAIICGKIIIEEEAFIGPYAVIRADETKPEGGMDPIIIGARSNVQDGVVIHSKDGGAVTIGKQVSIAHRSIVHGPCTVEDECFIGFNSVLFNCTVGARSVIRHNSVVEACEIPAGFHVPSATSIHNDDDVAKIVQITPDEATFSESVVSANRWLAEGYKRIANEL
ncbi:MAG: carbonate dehydratase [Alphaproteobacteria bacterium]